MTNRDSANRGELLPLLRWMERLDDTSRADITNYARANVERALAESREECERLRNDLAWKDGLLESGLETIRFRGEFLAALANEMRAEGVVLEQEPMRVVNHHKARAERLAEALREIAEECWTGVRPIQVKARAALNLEPTP